MREILFRGKSNWNDGKVKVGDWIYSMTISRHCSTDTEITSYYIGGGNKTIDGKTLGQYTGLTDKNGTKIFEGDIILYGLTPCVVEYETENARFMLYENGKHLKNGFNIDTMKLKEVIGNIHDNPELLGGKGNG